MSHFEKDAVKIYAITFNRYMNALSDTVSDGGEIGKTEYIHCNQGTVLIREDEFDYYRQFGGGIKTMNFVGIMYDTRKG